MNSTESVEVLHAEANENTILLTLRCSSTRAALTLAQHNLSAHLNSERSREHGLLVHFTCPGGDPIQFGLVRYLNEHGTGWTPEYVGKCLRTLVLFGDA